MERELYGILTAIKDKTGIEIAVLSEDGVKEASTFSTYIPLDYNLIKSCGSEVLVDSENDKTYFKFVFNGIKYIGVINGASKNESNYAVFIINYIENNQIKSTQLSYEELFTAIILGDTTKSRTLHFMNKYSISKSVCFCMIFKCDMGKSKEVCDFLRDYTVGGSDNAVIIDETTCAFVKFVEGGVDTEYRSPSEYAGFIVRSLFEELGIDVAVYVGGKVNTFADIATSYKQAVATETMSSSFGIQSGVKSYKDYILVKIMEDISPSKIEEFISVLLDRNTRKVLKDKELMVTGEEYLNNDLNVSETARVLYIHRNTLLYRLNKLEKITGLDLRKFNDAMEFRLISVLGKFIN
jgi:carbohydrate diacid regulator